MTEEPIDDLPVMLRVRGRRCVVVGAGGVGAHRARVLSAAGARVVIVAPQVHPSVRLCSGEIHERLFEPTDLDGAFLAVAATDTAAINAAVAAAAAERGVLVNRADDASAGDLTIMAAHRDGPLTVAVHTGGASASAAARVRDQLVAALDPDLARLLAVALPARRAIQERVADAVTRTAMLRRLTDEQAMAVLKQGGEPALRDHYAGIMKGLAPPPPGPADP